MEEKGFLFVVKFKTNRIKFALLELSTPGPEDERMGHDDLPLAVEGDVGIVSLDPKLSQLSHHQVSAVQAHVVCMCVQNVVCI